MGISDASFVAESISTLFAYGLLSASIVTFGFGGALSASGYTFYIERAARSLELSLQLFLVGVGQLAL